MAPFPIDLGGVGDAVGGAADTAVNGATGAVETATDKGAGAVATATDKAAGAVSTATSAAGDVVDGANKTAALLKWLDKIQDYIDKIEGYWDEYKNLIIFIFALIQDLEKQHGDLKKGWSDPTYMARACGRHELPEEPMARARWHWWGHEDGYVHRVVVGITDCLGTTIDKEKRLMKEMSSAAGRDEHFRKLMERASAAKGRMAVEGEEIKARINRDRDEIVGKGRETISKQDGQGGMGVGYDSR
ncbi:hypothetical protein I350_05288 [Cryptococcus amylolentus CBS 6273]|uniref:Uncharacterized protein n=1 Tax=Cryptococcus amylolentus CBS 6273 TaxID=1296118 RepID=A0A1E3JV21_9TREE|nr:hypothetical protein I350_05288 [Cryptococcus amylolentus CBS 6273]